MWSCLSGFDRLHSFVRALIEDCSHSANILVAMSFNLNCEHFVRVGLQQLE